MIDDENWSLNKDKDMIKFYKNPNVEEGMLIKRLTKVNASIDDAASSLFSYEFIKKIMDKIEDIHTIEDLGEDIEIGYQKLKGNMLVSSRDFCFCKCRFDLKNGDICIMQASTEHDSVSETTK